MEENAHTITPDIMCPYLTAHHFLCSLLAGEPKPDQWGQFIPCEYHKAPASLPKHRIVVKRVVGIVVIWQALYAQPLEEARQLEEI